MINLDDNFAVPKLNQSVTRKAAMTAKWKEANRVKVLEGARSYYHRNKEKMNAYSKQWQLNHKERYQQYSRNWRVKNKDRMKALQLKWNYGLTS